MRGNTESYRRLTESGIMSIVPVCNPLSLGNYSQVLVGLRNIGLPQNCHSISQMLPAVAAAVTARMIQSESLIFSCMR